MVNRFLKVAHLPLAFENVDSFLIWVSRNHRMEKTVWVNNASPALIAEAEIAKVWVSCHTQGFAIRRANLNVSLAHDSDIL